MDVVGDKTPAERLERLLRDLAAGSARELADSKATSARAELLMVESRMMAVVANRAEVDARFFELVDAEWSADAEAVLDAEVDQ